MNDSTFVTLLLIASVFWASIAFFTGKIAQKAGRGFAGWFFAAAFFSAPIALIALVAISVAPVKIHLSTPRASR